MYMGGGPNLWPGLCNLIQVRMKYNLLQECRSRSVRYYISNRPTGVDDLPDFARGQ